jgi:tripartite-type tricarboxylate transporter receptor subunit TctC
VPHYQSGKLRGILLDHKVAALPDIPTLRDLGYQQDLPVSFFGFFAPTGIPDEAKKVLVPAIEKAIKTHELTTKLQKLWYVTNYKSPAELKQMLSENYEKAKSIAKKMRTTDIFQRQRLRQTVTRLPGWKQPFSSSAKSR